MAQKLYTKQFGEIDVESSWVEGNHHLARLTNGAYVHITGLPVNSKDELQLVLRGPELERALNWFDHRHDDEGKNPLPQRVMFTPDGAPVFEDGTPVESPSDLVHALKPGPVLDAALMALAKKLEEKRRIEKLAHSKKAGATAKGMKGKARGGPKNPPPKQAPQAPPKPAEGEEARSITV